MTVPPVAGQHEILAHTQATLEDVRRLHDEHLEHLRERAQPAGLEVVRLQASRLVKSFDAPSDTPWLSIGVLNPNALTVYVGVNGSATLEGEAWPVGSKSTVVLPVAANLIEVGIDPADSDALTTLGSDEALIYLLRFHSVQPFFLAGWPG